MADGRGPAEAAERLGSGAHKRRLWLAAALAAGLLAPVVAAPLASRALADHLGRKAGAELAAALPSGRAPSEDPSDPRAREESAALPPVPSGEIGEAPSELLAQGSTQDEPQPGPTPARSQREAPAGRRGILVRADAVERAVKRGVQPSASFVPASGMRPEGLALYGVSGYGAGLRDGDVLTSVAGAAATSPGAVVAAVAGAVRAKAKAISGVVWRGDERLSVTVEIPPLARLKRQPRAR